MTPETIGAYLLIGSFILLIILRVPIAFAVAISTVATFLFLDIPLDMMITNIVKGLNAFSLMAIPFFMIAGEIMGSGGISNRLINLSKALVGWLRGGLAMVNIVASMFFGGISGSAAADTSSLGTILIPMMEKDGYDLDFATNVTMASSVQGILIPPSHNMVLFALAAGSVSISKLFLAGMVPGVLLGVALMIYSYIISVIRKYPKGDPFSLRRVFFTFIDAVFGLFTVVIVVIGVLTGLFTATESAAIAVVWAMIVTFGIYREIKLRELWNILGRALGTLSICMIVIGFSSAFGWLLAYLKVPSMLADSVMGLTENPVIILIMINLMLLFLGAIMDMSSIIIIATPILMPILLKIGVDPVHFGAVMILNLGIGLLTPPVGGVLFIGSAISGVKIEHLTKTLLPFYAVMLAVLVLITYVPEIVMTIPNIFG